MAGKTPKRAKAKPARKAAAAKAAPSLEERIGHRFTDRALLARALTHAGMAGGIDSNERLDFLGDRALGLAIAAMLYERFPEEREADLAGASSPRCAPKPDRGGRGHRPGRQVKLAATTPRPANAVAPGCWPTRARP